ncbi:MAG: 30S ribosomal protein S6 [Firmicutes bacterium]|nr:30S ribosomal protein S6 [Bacillota bacterium]
MRDYEVMYILDAELDEENIDAAVARFEDVVKNDGGEIVKTERWGKRKLAYEINDKNEGYYVLMYFKSPSGAAQELERILKLNDDVLRHLLVKKEE